MNQKYAVDIAKEARLCVLAVDVAPEGEAVFLCDAVGSGHRGCDTACLEILGTEEEQTPVRGPQTSADSRRGHVTPGLARENLD